MEGLIFSIKRYSVHDGPGIRVTVFMKGCPLSCHWCHNPEGISPGVGTILEWRKVGENDYTKPVEVGKYYSVDDILQILAKDRIFFQQSGGGVTFSGGEPMAQPEFLLGALKACRENGFHTVVDTSGYCQEADLKEIMRVTDLFMFDIKHLDEQKHIGFTGVSNRVILENFHILLRSGMDIIVRIPVVPGVNDDPGHLSDLKKFLTEAGRNKIKGLNLLPFHRIGASKYRRLGLPYRMAGIEPPSRERMRELKEFFSGTGLKVKVGG